VKWTARADLVRVIDTLDRFLRLDPLAEAQVARRGGGGRGAKESGQTGRRQAWQRPA